ncbi:MAG: glutaredoxin 3 [Myxococcaceae bacterium]
MKPVKIYTTTYCGYCARAKDLLRNKKILFDEVDVTGDDAAREKLVQMSGGRKTVPQIFIGETHVGGYMDLAQLEKDGKLDQMLSDDPKPFEKASAPAY